jgi:hypothetical protein
VTSLRERIEAKKRRTARFPLQVGDAAAAQAQVQMARAALELHQQKVQGRRAEEGGQPTDAENKRTIVLRGVLKEAKAREAKTVAEIELESLDDEVWDRVISSVPDDEEGGFDLDDVRHLLLAESCTDPDLRDADWWGAPKARPEFSKGDKLALNNVLLALNLNTPTGRQGKG